MNSSNETDFNTSRNAAELFTCDICVNGQEPSAYNVYNLVVIGVCIPIIGFFGTIGNALAAFVYSRPVMRSSVNLYLCSLAISDMFVIMTAFFLFFLLSIECPGGPTISYAYGMSAPYIYPFSMTVQTASVYFVIAAALDCFACSVLPTNIKEMVCTSHLAKKVIYSIVLFSILYNLVHWFEVTSMECFEVAWNTSTLIPVPTEFRRNPLYYQIYYTYLYSVIMAIGPLIILIVLNTTIIIVTFALSKDKNSDDGSEDVVTLVLVVFLFIFCNSLALIINFLETFADLGPTLSYLVDFSNLLVVCNSSVNFIIYYAFGENFRRTLKFFVRYKLYYWSHCGPSEIDTLESARSIRRKGVCEHTFYGEDALEESANSTTQGDYVRWNQLFDGIVEDLLSQADGKI